MTSDRKPIELKARGARTVAAGDDCCENKACEVEALVERQDRVLKIVLAINAVMFLVEGSASNW